MRDETIRYPIENFEPTRDEGPTRAAAREVPPFLDGWNRYKGERVQVLTTDRLLFTGRLDTVTSSHDGSLHAITLHIERVQKLGADPTSAWVVPGAAPIFKAATIPGAAVVLIEFAD